MLPGPRLSWDGARRLILRLWFAIWSPRIARLTVSDPHSESSVRAKEKRPAGKLVVVQVALRPAAMKFWSGAFQGTRQHLPYRSRALPLWRGSGNQLLRVS